MKMVIYGASDDLVEVESETFREEWDTNGDDRWEGLVVAPDGNTLIVTAQFGAPGANRDDWTLGVENTYNRPNWPIQFGTRPDRDSDPAIILEVPEGTKVKAL